MRRYVLAPDGDRFRLDLQTVADPQPGAGEVLVRVRACSLNYRDLVMIRNERKLPVGGLVNRIKGFRPGDDSRPFGQTFVAV